MRSRWLGTVILVVILASAGLGLFWPFKTSAEAPKLKLVVVLVFDQLRGDYLKKWEPLFGEGGFKRLSSEGAWFTNCHYPYAVTVTAAGHTSLMTGCTPRDHGIVGNEWYDRKVRKRVVAAGTGSAKDRQMGPERRLVPTLGDMLLKSSRKSKVASLSIKPRSAILLAAVHAQICYWMSNLGLFETSLHYRNEPHDWIEAFNKSRKFDSFIGQPWDRFKTVIDYAQFSGPDDVEFEGTGYKQGRTFPHPTLNLEAVINSPFGNDVLLDLARAAITAEQLGQRDVPDLLCLSFSSNDLVGHCYGPDSQEVLDITLRSDVIVKDLLDFLDREVGKGNYAVALSADHGVCPIPELALSQGKDAGYVSPKLFTSQAESFLNKKFGAKDVPWIEQMETESYDSQVFVNPGVLKELRGVTPEEVERALAEWLATQPGIQAAYPRTMLLSKEVLKDPVAEMVRQSVIPDNCGEAFAVLKPYYFVGTPIAQRKKEKDKNYATTHGSCHDYDTYVPLLAMGPGVIPGIHEEKVTPLAMAFILAKMLKIEPPANTSARFAPPQSLWKVSSR